MGIKENLIPSTTMISKNTITTFAFLTVTVAVFAQYDWIFPYASNGLFGYTNSNGDTITPAIFEEAEETFGTLGKVKYQGRYGYINNSGEIAISPEYVTATKAHYNLYILTTRRGKKKAFDRAGDRIELPSGPGRAVHDPCHQSGFCRRMHGLNIYRENGQYGLVMDKYIGRTDGKIQTQFDTLHTLFDTILPLNNHFIYVIKQNKIAILDPVEFEYGAEHIDTTLAFIWDDIKFFECPYSDNEYHEIFGYKVGELWGYSRSRLTLYTITEPKYLSISSLIDGICLVEYAPGRFGYIDDHGVEYFTIKQ